MRCCARDGGRSSGVALQGEASNHRRLRRLRAGVVSAAGKGAAVIASGVGREGERKRTADDVSKEYQMASKPGHDPWLRDESGGDLLTAQVASGMKAARAWSGLWRGTWEPVAPIRRSPAGGWPARGRPQAAETARGRVPTRGTGADRLVVAVKPGNAGGAKGTGHPGVFGGQPAVAGGAGERAEVGRAKPFEISK